MVKAGDKVRLTNRTGRMTVEKVVGDKAHCFWFSDGQLVQDVFDVKDLEKLRS